MFVLLHLQAALVDSLDAAQAKHLLVDAEILDMRAQQVEVKNAPFAYRWI